MFDHDKDVTHEVVIGPITYEVHRVHQGKISCNELLTERICKAALDNPTFDETPADAV